MRDRSGKRKWMWQTRFAGHGPKLRLVPDVGEAPQGRVLLHLARGLVTAEGIEEQDAVALQRPVHVAEIAPQDRRAP